MIENVPRLDAQMICVRRLQILKVPPDLVVERKAHFRVGTASADNDLVTTVA